MGLDPRTAPDKMLTLEGVAHILDCSTETVRRMIARGDLKATRYGPRVIRVLQSDLDRAGRPVTRIDLVSTRSLDS